MILGFRESVIVGFYQVNKEFIIQNYCVNKDKPEMKCDGKCHMKKMLKKSKKKENEAFPVNSYEVKPSQYLKAQFDANLLSKQELPLEHCCSFKNRMRVKLFSHSIFHPPQA